MLDEIVMTPERLEKMLAPVIPALTEIHAYALGSDDEVQVFPVLGWRCGDGELSEWMPVLPGGFEFNSKTHHAWALRMPDGRFLRPHVTSYDTKGAWLEAARKE